MSYHIVLAVFASAFLSVVAVYLLFSEKVGRQNRRVRARLEALTSEMPRENGVVYPILRDDTLSDIPYLHGILSKFRFSGKLQHLIDQSGLPVKAGALVLGMLSLGGLLFLLVMSFLKIFPVALAMGFVGAILPYAYVQRKRRKRQEEFESLLPEAIDLMANALKAGFSLESALSLVAKEIPDPVGIEFAIAFEEQNLGVASSEALSNMGRRVESEDLELMITALSIQKKTGGNLVEILEKIAYTVRERFRLKREVRIFTAQGRFSGFVLVVLPIVVAVVLTALNPDYLKTLLVEKVGNYLLGSAIFMQLVGIWVIRRIVNIRI